VASAVVLLILQRRQTSTPATRSGGHRRRRRRARGAAGGTDSLDPEQRAAAGAWRAAFGRPLPAGVGYTRCGATCLNRFGKTIDTSKLVSFLRANREGERYLLATSTHPGRRADHHRFRRTGDGARWLSRTRPGGNAAVYSRAWSRGQASAVRHAGRRRPRSAAAWAPMPRGKRWQTGFAQMAKPVDPALWRNRSEAAAAELYDLRHDAAPPAVPGNEQSIELFRLRAQCRHIRAAVRSGFPNC